MGRSIAHLRVKLKTLADESRNIRNEELKIIRRRRKLHSEAKYDEDEVIRLKAHTALTKHQYEDEIRLSDLCKHRRVDVRSAARATHLAYGYLRGRPYVVMEQKAKSWPDWTEVRGIVKRFGSLEQLKDYDAWESEATGVPVRILTI